MPSLPLPQLDPSSKPQLDILSENTFQELQLSQLKLVMVAPTPGDAALSTTEDQELPLVPAENLLTTPLNFARLTAPPSPPERSATPPKIPIDSEEFELMTMNHDVVSLVNTTKIDKKFIFIFKHKT